MNPVVTLLEGKWFAGRRISVDDLFEPVLMWASGNSHHYEQFTNSEAFCDAIKYAFKPHRAKTIYIGAHGNQKGIRGFHDEGISRVKIKNALSAIKGHTKRGIYFGSCDFVTGDNAHLILSNCPRVQWVAGYSLSVDWVDSAVFDLFFFRHFLSPSPGKGVDGPGYSVSKRLEYASRVIDRDMAPLAKRLGFQIFVRSKSGIKQLIVV